MGFQMKLIAKAENDKVEFTAENMYKKYVERVRKNLHVVLTFSPIGDTLRRSMRMYPSLVNCCVINWFKVRYCQLLLHLFDCQIYTLFCQGSGERYLPSIADCC